MNRPTRYTMFGMAFCLILAAFHACAARAENPENTIYSAFIACAQNEADQYQAVSNSPTEIARAAVTKCNVPWRKGFADVLRLKRITVGTRQRPLFSSEMELQSFVDKSVDGLIDTITAYVLENRKKMLETPAPKPRRPKGSAI